MTRLLYAVLLLMPLHAQAATYYMSPSGSDTNSGTSSGSPWLTFTKAFSMLTCGDTLVLLDGVYGDGSSTGKINQTGITCTSSTILTVAAQNSRQARIHDNGTGTGTRLLNSAYITFDGIVFSSANNNSVSGAGVSCTSGIPFYANNTDFLTIRNALGRNPNKYCNVHPFFVISSRDTLIVDTEVYDFHRHGINPLSSERVVMRRVYGNCRTGVISGGYNTSVGIGNCNGLVSFYPCKDCIAENIILEGRGELFEMNGTGSVAMSGSKVLGSIAYQTGGTNNCMYLNPRAVGDLYSPTNILVENVVCYQHNSANLLRATSVVGSTFNKLTLVGQSGAVNGARFDDSTNGSATTDFTLTNSIITNVSSLGISESGYTSFSGSNNTAFSTGTAYTPALPSSWSSPTASDSNDPQLGTCIAWVPDGSAAQVAGRGANILYRYENGVETTTPLWDLSTGEFPHGAIDRDGINNVAGSSAQDVHQRLNINSNGCSFPASYGGGSGPASTVIRGTTTASGLSATASPLSWPVTVSASQDGLGVCIGLWDNAANVGSVSAIDVSGQAMTLVKRQVTSPSAYRAAEYWWLTSPTAGARTITATLTGTIAGVLGRATEFDVTSGPNTAVGASTSGAQTTLSVTAPTNDNERVEDCTVSSSAFTYTHGADQTGDADLDHATQSLKLATSTQNGSDGGVMSDSTGGTTYQAKVAVSLTAAPVDPPLTATLTLSRYQFIETYGTESGAGALSAVNSSASIGTNGEFRLRTEITASVATTSAFGAALYCQRNGGGYTRVVNTIGSHGMQLYGSAIVENLPTHLTSTSQRFTPSGSFVAGSIIRDITTTFVVPALSSGTKTELEFIAAAHLSVGDTVTCQVRKDDGSQLEAYTVTPTFTAVAPSASFGF